MASQFKGEFQTQRQVTENITLEQSLQIIEDAEKHGVVKATILCSKCSSQLTPAAKFCGNCGVSLGGAQELKQGGQPVLGSKAAFLGGAAVDIKSAVGKAAAAEHSLAGRNPALAALQQFQSAKKPMVDLTK